MRKRISQRKAVRLKNRVRETVVRTHLRKPQGPSRRPSFMRQERAIVVLFAAGFGASEIARMVNWRESSVQAAVRKALR